MEWVMNSFFSQMKEIEKIITEIKKFINVEDRAYYNASTPELTEAQKIEWKNSKAKIESIINGIYSSSDILNDQKLISLEIFLRQLRDELGRVNKNFYNDPDGDFASNLSNLSNFLSRNTPIINFDSRYELDSDNKRKLLSLIKSKIPNFNQDNKIESFFNNNQENSKNRYILDRIFDLLNLYIKKFDEIEVLKEKEKIIQDIDIFLELEEKSDKVNDLVVQSVRILEEIKEQRDQINENFSVILNSDLLKGYDKETRRLGRKIIFLSFVISVLFLTIIGLFIFKFKNLYNYFYEIPKSNIPNFFENPWYLLSFFTLIFSISALLTYLIKDRNRLIKLYDHFNLNWLELSAMPKYMAELSPDERKYLYITLAPTYFKGFYPSKDAPSEIQKVDIDSISKFLDSISKISQDFKNPK